MAPTGKPVRIRGGPAAVSGDETCIRPLPVIRSKAGGKAQGVG